MRHIWKLGVVMGLALLWGTSASADSFFCCGNDDYGALGIDPGETDDLLVFTEVELEGQHVFTSVEAGNGTSFGIDQNGVVWGWGAGGAGQLGDGEATSGHEPVRPIIAEGQHLEGNYVVASQIAASNIGAYTLALTNDHRVLAWGSGGSCIGDGIVGSYDRLNAVWVVTDPEGPVYLENITQIAATYPLSVAVSSSHTVWTWGSNYGGGLGIGQDSTSVPSSYVAVPVVGPQGSGFLSDVVQVAVGGHFVLARKSNGEVWAWGHNSSGQLGNGSWTDSTVPVKVNLPSDTAVDITAAESAAFALLSDKSVWSWGDNGMGLLGVEGLSTSVDTNVPVRVSGPKYSGTQYLTDIVDIEAGRYHVMAVTTAGNLRGWGISSHGCLGTDPDPQWPEEVVPVAIFHVGHVSAVSLGMYHTIALGDAMEPIEFSIAFDSGCIQNDDTRDCYGYPWMYDRLPGPANSRYNRKCQATLQVTSDANSNTEYNMYWRELDSSADFIPVYPPGEYQGVPLAVRARGATFSVLGTTVPSFEVCSDYRSSGLAYGSVRYEVWIEGKDEGGMSEPVETTSIVIRRTGDIDCNGGVEPTDLGLLINKLNGMPDPGFTMREFDMDGNGGAEPTDMSILINILNGLL
ncbi:MAG: hypothetical protein JXL80_13720 [Planctomycetes bacterium]|nr:hypothetical protein [Planctomycetota bacterium]